MLAKAAIKAIAQYIHSDTYSGFISATNGAKIVATLEKILQMPNEAARMEVGKSKLFPKYAKLKQALIPNLELRIKRLSVNWSEGSKPISASIPANAIKKLKINVDFNPSFLIIYPETAYAATSETPETMPLM